MGNGGNQKVHLKKICHYFKDSVLPYVAAVGILTYAASNIFISVGKLCLEITVSVCVCVAIQLRRIKRSDGTLSAELTPYNIVPLEAPSLTNAIRVFPEVSQVLNKIYFNMRCPCSLAILLPYF